MNEIIIQNITRVNGKNVTDYKTLNPEAILDDGKTLPAGQAGTAGLAGVMTLQAGHGLTTQSVVAVSWLESGVQKRRYNCSITHTETDSVTVATGAGDTLPTSGAVIVSSRVQLNMSFDGSDLEYLFLGSDVPAVMTLETAVAVQLVADIGGGDAYQWRSGCGTNPVDGDDIVACNCYSLGVVAGSAEAVAAYDND